MGEIIININTTNELERITSLDRMYHSKYLKEVRFDINQSLIKAIVYEELLQVCNKKDFAFTDCCVDTVLFKIKRYISKTEGSARLKELNMYFKIIDNLDIHVKEILPGGGIGIPPTIELSSGDLIYLSNEGYLIMGDDRIRQRIPTLDLTVKRVTIYIDRLLKSLEIRNYIANNRDRDLIQEWINDTMSFHLNSAIKTKEGSSD